MVGRCLRDQWRHSFCSVWAHLWSPSFCVNIAIPWSASIIITFSRIWLPHIPSVIAETDSTYTVGTDNWGWRISWSCQLPIRHNRLKMAPEADSFPSLYSWGILFYLPFSGNQFQTTPGGVKQTTTIPTIPSNTFSFRSMEIPPIICITGIVYSLR